jgi:nitrite reductase (NO-forming)
MTAPVIDRAERTEQRGAPDRVKLAHAHAVPALRLALVFLAASVVTIPLHQSTAEWLPLHLFLAGTVVLAISGASLLLTITWASAPAPARTPVLVQRWCVAGGAATIAFGRASSAPDAVVAAGGIVFLGGLVLLGVLLVTTVRRGVERRYDVPVAWYVVALGSGVAAGGVGVAMATSPHALGVRDAHVTLNLLGLVGLVIGGTFPFFIATVGRTKTAPRATPRRHVRLLAWQTVALVTAAAGLLGSWTAAATIGFVAYALGVAALATLAPVPRARSLRWAGPRLVAMYAGLAWWAAAVLAFAASSASGADDLRGGWLLALVVAGYGQILWGSLAYLVPMLRGGGHRALSAGFATTRSWVGLVAVNAAGVLFVTGVRGATAGGLAATVLVVDTVVRSVLASRSTAHV